MSRPGKKVGTLRVTLRRDTGRGNRKWVTKELRLDDRGTFHAEHDGEWYSAKTQAELEEQLRARIEHALELVWRRYLVVDYKAEVRFTIGSTGRPTYSGNLYRLGLESREGGLVEALCCDKSYGDVCRERLEGDHLVVNQVCLTWKLEEWTDPYRRPEADDGDPLVRSSRAVCTHHDDSGESIGQPYEHEDANLPEGAVLYTVEREQVLRDVLAAMGVLDAKLAGLFGGGADDLATRLDGVNAARLLGGGS